MKDQSYTATIEITKSPKDVFNHINDVSKWWTNDVSGQQTEFEGQSTKLHDEFVLRHGDNHYSKHKLIEVTPNKKIVWLVTDSTLNWIKGNKEEWTGTKMIFELVPKGEKTTLIFTHAGLGPQLECYSHSAHLWDMVFKVWLFNFIVTGRIA